MRSRSARWMTTGDGPIDCTRWKPLLPPSGQAREMIDEWALRNRQIEGGEREVGWNEKSEGGRGKEGTRHGECGGEKSASPS